VSKIPVCISIERTHGWSGSAGPAAISLLYPELCAMRVTLEEADEDQTDKALVERGLAASRERATALVLAGRVLVSEQRVRSREPRSTSMRRCAFWAATCAMSAAAV